MDSHVSMEVWGNLLDLGRQFCSSVEPGRTSAVSIKDWDYKSYNKLVINFFKLIKPIQGQQYNTLQYTAILQA